MSLSPDAMHEALRHCRRSSTTSSPLQELLLFRQLRRAQSALTDIDLTRLLVDEALEQFAAQRPDLAEILRLRFIEGVKTDVAMTRLSISSSEFHRRQRAAIDGLASIVQVQEMAARDVFAASMLDRLGPPGYDRLFGFDRHLETLDRLLDPDNGRTPVIGVYGIGGLGKTSLADKYLRTAIQAARFEHFAFVTARPFGFRAGFSGQAPLTTAETIVEKLARQLLGDDHIPVPFNLETTVRLLGEQLRTTDHLIVLDNLETVADLDRLLGIVTQWTGSGQPSASRFVLTSRHQAAPGYGVYPFHVPALDKDDALQLVRHAAGQSGLHAVEHADDETLSPIYAAVGGNPLALLLVTGQLRDRPLPAVLATLHTQRGQFAEEMYAHIFRHSLDQLDEQAMHVLTLMPLMPEQGASYAMLRALTGLDDGVLGDALRRLVEMNLVTHILGPSLDESIYTIHTLTATYLAEQMRTESDLDGGQNRQ